MYRFPCLGRSEVNSHILTLRLYLSSLYKIHRSVSKPAAQMNWGITALYVMQKTAHGSCDSAKICPDRTLGVVPTTANGAWLSWSLLMLLFKAQWNRNIFGVHSFKIWTPFYLLCLCSPSPSVLCGAELLGSFLYIRGNQPCVLGAFNWLPLSELKCYCCF